MGFTKFYGTKGSVAGLSPISMHFGHFHHCTSYFRQPACLCFLNFSSAVGHDLVPLLISFCPPPSIATHPTTPLRRPSIQTTSEQVFDGSTVEAFPDVDLPNKPIDMRMTPDGTKWWIAGLEGEVIEVRNSRGCPPAFSSLAEVFLVLVDLTCCVRITEVWCA